VRARTRAEAARWAELACLLEVAAPKPGNVNRRHDFADATLPDFLASATALGEALRGRGPLRLGKGVLRAVRGTRRLTGTNTNLGMALLLVPLALGAVRSPRGALREGVRSALDGADAEDARLVYEAIRLAAPGGLGRAERHDLSGEAPPSLREAMAEAASRDSVAREYVSGFERTFGLVLPALRRGLTGGLDLSGAILRAFLEVLAAVPDTLIARKAGPEAAEEVSGAARALRDRSAPEGPIDPEGLATLDARLRSRGNLLNPGTTADLTAAGLFALLAEAPPGSEGAILRANRDPRPSPS
jgi:triphosphoribosyl-dephospho-CoA synthase